MNKQISNIYDLLWNAKEFPMCATMREETIPAIESLQARVKELEEVAQRRLEYIDKKNERIEELKASRKEALEYLQREGTPYVNAAIAALNE